MDETLCSSWLQEESKKLCLFSIEASFYVGLRTFVVIYRPVETRDNVKYFNEMNTCVFPLAV